jgi:hypothetical protein
MWWFVDPSTQLLPLLVVVGLTRILCRYRKESKLSIKSTYSTWSSALADQPVHSPHDQPIHPVRHSAL